MRKGPLNPKYVRVEVRIGLVTGKAFRTGQIVGIGDNTQVIGLDKTIETVIFKETLEGMEDKIIIEAGTGQGKRHLQEIIVVAEIEVQATVDLGQVLE